ncbi:MAG: alanine acetyltransferase [Alphaproteobacteria bacterium]|nr:MAG: alanine acetyltransferase [Alphaproteobacteria bacterium]
MSASGPILRPVGPFDLDCLAALHAACFPDPWSATAMATLLATPGSFGVLSATPDQPAGFVLARVAADEAEILSIGVGPGWRRRGIARQLLAAVSARAAESGARRLFLEVAADNHPARALYLREGFAQVGRRPRYYRRAGGAVDALVLARALAAEPPSSGPS